MGRDFQYLIIDSKEHKDLFDEADDDQYDHQFEDVTEARNCFSYDIGYDKFYTKEDLLELLKEKVAAGEFKQVEFLARVLSACYYGVIFRVG